MAPNIRLLAMEAGDLLKYETTLKEIDRYGMAILRISVERFPVDAISSQRAQSIFDWLCSIGRTEMDPSARAEAVRAFLHQLAHNKPELCTQLDEALRRSGFPVPRAVEPSRSEDVTRIETPKRSRQEFEKARESLLSRFDGMFVSAQSQRRGYELQDLLNELLAIHGVPAARSFTRNDGGEQIDGAFRHGAWYYLVECRWRREPADTRDLDGLVGQVNRSGKQSMGLFLSMNGWSANVVPLLKQNASKSILLADGVDLRAVLTGALSFQELLDAKERVLNLEGEPYYSSNQIVRDRKS
ncbi:restriction endonuclease [Myxococcus sp. MxC21-1]|uniref:restriction endonuclease n=1 Tax=Myxococcus sp. MxC21-1 TaxID=3041439 RepID=UPI0029309134|nr:restriction endonuclease [Myxococcus sp. MxC21-1]WNZ60940.1 restriction endonuclease [Myxococcus sp. MxC21-1]